MCEEIDAIGLICPLPVLRLQPLAPGTRIRLIATDRAALLDIPHFCNESGHSLLSSREEDGHYIFEIEKRN